MVSIFVNRLQLFFFFLNKVSDPVFNQGPPITQPSLYKGTMSQSPHQQQTANWCCTDIRPNCKLMLQIELLRLVLQRSSSKPNCLLSNSLSYEGCWRTEIYTDYCKSYLNNSQLAMILDQITSSILTVNSPLFSLLPSQ